MNSQRSLCCLLLFPMPYRLIRHSLRCLKCNNISVVFLLKEASDLVEPFLVLCSTQNGLENSEEERGRTCPWVQFPLLKQSVGTIYLAYKQSVLLHSNNSVSYRAAKMSLFSHQKTIYHALSYKTNATFSVKSQIRLGWCWWRYQKSQQGFKTHLMETPGQSHPTLYTTSGFY